MDELEDEELEDEELEDVVDACLRSQLNTLNRNGKMFAHTSVELLDFGLELLLVVVNHDEELEVAIFAVVVVEETGPGQGIQLP